MPKRKICVITGTRADYGLLYWLMKEIQADPDLQLQVVVTGMHLAPEFGLTYKVIEDAGFDINAKVEMLLASDTAVGITKSIGLGVIGFADVLDSLKPDLLVLLGDRFETLAAAQAALVARTPIAHLFGGDTTEGAFDEAIRHSITKMAHLHFVSNEFSAARVRQLGENPEHVYTFGSTGIDQIKRLALLSRQELEDQTGFNFQKKNLLITFHPATLEKSSPEKQFQGLLDSLNLLGPEVGVIFTYPNADPAGRSLIPLIDSFVEKHPHAKAFASLGQLRYLSAMAQVDAVVGNSSSGLYEAPSFKIPTVNIGDRQKGRLQAASVINCEPVAESIIVAIQKAFAMDCTAVVNPFGDGDSSQRIKDVLKSVPLNEDLIKKHFFDIR
jgi:UDP-N-acetylglucosamine 2-epimerase (non-hydrolysing)/GDP/UDP-N,N'-diacetylbacillosamine 2-epimerase (hydrolysing)